MVSPCLRFADITISFTEIKCKTASITFSCLCMLFVTMLRELKVRCVFLRIFLSYKSVVDIVALIRRGLFIKMSSTVKLNIRGNGFGY